MPAKTTPAPIIRPRPAQRVNQQITPEGSVSGQAKSRGAVVGETVEYKSFPPVETDGTAVHVELGTTENLGDMNFGKCAVRVVWPCTKKNIRAEGLQAYEQADAMLEEFTQRFIHAPQA